MDIITRDLHAADLPAVAALSAELTGQTTAHAELLKRFQLIERWPGQAVFVAECCGAVVGFAHVQLRVALHAHSDAELTALVVSETSRRAGCGSALVATAERWARAQGACQLSLRSRADRTNAHAFYASIGYAISSTSYKLTKQL